MTRSRRPARLSVIAASRFVTSTPVEFEPDVGARRMCHAPAVGELVYEMKSLAAAVGLGIAQRDADARAPVDDLDADRTLGDVAAHSDPLPDAQAGV